ncbi:MAG: septum formation initiator family protein [Proteobacteria bacterium]|nr:septum formation initiator family protein [Pseudomonadota bacterium]
MARLLAPIRSTRRMLPTLLGVCAVVYFGYHALQGERGVMTLLQLERRVDQAAVDLRAVEAERDALERNVELMLPTSLDRDMLEERARVVLNYTRLDEIVIMRDALDPGDKPN